MAQLPAVRLSQYAVETASKRADSIRPLVRINSPTLTTACRQAGLPLDIAEMCGGLLASVLEDLQAIGRLRRSDIERSIRMEAVLAATDEPACSALRIAMAASPVNGRAVARHWDAICEKHERGKLAWLLGMDTETSYGYGRKLGKRT